jgi:hypothetical protein
MRKVVFLLAMLGALAFLPFQATPAHAQNVVDSISDMFEQLLGGNGGGNDQASDIGNAVEDVVNQGQGIGNQFEDLGHQISDAF